MLSVVAAKGRASHGSSRYPRGIGRGGGRQGPVRPARATRKEGRSMSMSKLRWRAASALIAAGAPAAAATLGLTVPALGSARAAPPLATPGWHLRQQFGTCGSSFGVRSVTATRARNAWATGDYSVLSNGECSPAGLLITHWDGHSCQNKRPPIGFRPHFNPYSVGQ